MKGTQKEEKTVLLTGPTIVTRSPCLLTSSIQVLNAVDRREELGHLTNVIVFSSKGPRPMCNIISDGDLDGDVYFVCWDKEMIAGITEKRNVLPDVDMSSIALVNPP